MKRALLLNPHHNSKPCIFETLTYNVRFFSSKRALHFIQKKTMVYQKSLTPQPAPLFASIHVKTLTNTIHFFSSKEALYFIKTVLHSIKRAQSLNLHHYSQPYISKHQHFFMFLDILYVRMCNACERDFGCVCVCLEPQTTFLTHAQSCYYGVLRLVGSLKL